MRRLLAPALTTLVALTAALTVAIEPARADGTAPAPGSPGYVARDLRNIADAYGRVVGPGGQLANPAYLPALVKEATLLSAHQLLAQAATPLRPVLTAAQLVPGWNVGNPLRAGWNGTRGTSRQVSFLNRYGALIRGTVYAPKPGARDPYTGVALTGPFPGVVITPGSVQGSQGMYVWLAQDLAERGYVVLSYDTQGQGTSETFPHLGGTPAASSALPFCNPFATPVDGNATGCPGVPFQQLAPFVTGTQDALDWFLSPENPYLDRLDRTPDAAPATPGRTSRIAIIGHSMGAAAVSHVQGVDDRVATVVALDKLAGEGGAGGLAGTGGSSAPNVPAVPALAIQSEYGFTVAPFFAASGGIVPGLGLPSPTRERATGYDDWVAAGQDAMLVVPRASTHLEYTDIPYVLPASRWGQALSSVTIQAWLDRYLKHTGSDAALTGPSFTYLEPRGRGVWEQVTLAREPLLSFYYCSAYSFRSGAGSDGPRVTDGDVGRVGGCGS